MPQRIAKYLGLPNADRYTGKSFHLTKKKWARRTSVTIYADSGATIEALKRHSGHSSTKVCESYIAAVSPHRHQLKVAPVLCIWMCHWWTLPLVVIAKLQLLSVIPSLITLAILAERCIGTYWDRFSNYELDSSGQSKFHGTNGHAYRLLQMWEHNHQL